MRGALVEYLFARLSDATPCWWLFLQARLLLNVMVLGRIGARVRV